MLSQKILVGTSATKTVMTHKSLVTRPRPDWIALQRHHQSASERGIAKIQSIGATVFGLLTGYRNSLCLGRNEFGRPDSFGTRTVELLEHEATESV